MTGRFAKGAATIMASRTTTVDLAVIEYRGKPGVADMAVIALAGGANMICRFSGRDTAVVTLETIAADLGVIHSRERCPGINVMAGIAGIAGADVADMLARRADAGRRAMAAAAATRRAFENTTRMASSAIGRGMAASERKSGHVMIERLYGVGPGGKRR